MSGKVLYLSLRNISKGRHDLVTPGHIPMLMEDGLIVRSGIGYQLTEKGKALLAELEAKFGPRKPLPRSTAKSKGFGIGD